MGVWHPEAEPNLLDLLYWECRVGVWGISMLTFKETAADVMPPINCARLLGRGLAVVKAQRRRRYEPYHETMRRYDHRLLEVPSNTTGAEPVQRLLARCLPLPWRLKKGLRLVS